MTDEEFAKQFPTMTWLLPHREPSPPKPSWSELPGNIVPSAVNAATGLYEMVRHPVRTLQAFETAAGGAMNLLGADEFNAYLADNGLAVRRSPQDIAREEATATAVGRALKDRYWGLENLKNTLITDPVGSALDVVGIATGVAGAARAPLAIGSRARLIEAPVAALTERRAIKPLGQAGADSEIVTPIIGEAGSTPLADGVKQYVPFDSPGKSQHLSEADHGERHKIFAPPTKPQRPFEADYLDGVKAGDVDKDGNLLVDRKGRLFNSGDKIFGRRTLGGSDVGAGHKDFRKLIKRLWRKPIEAVPRAHIDGSSGRVRYDENRNELRDVFIADDLDLRKTRTKHITDHEGSHLADILTGRVPMPLEVQNEAESVYSTLATGKENLPRLKLPSDRGYSGPKIRNELMAEVIRAALRDPNYMKTVTPKTYDWLSDLFAKHPHFGIRLNSLGAATVVALGAMGQKDESEAAETPREEDSQISSLRGAGPLDGPFAPVKSADEPTKAGTNSLTELKKALYRRGFLARSPRNENIRKLVRALADLDARQKSQFFEGPR